MTGLTSNQMSKLHKKLRRKGYSYKKALKIVGTAKKLSKKGLNSKGKASKKKHPYLDYDGDGKVNKYDCKPYNKWKQDETEEERKERMKLKFRELVQKKMKEEPKKVLENIHDNYYYEKNMSKEEYLKSLRRMHKHL